MKELTRRRFLTISAGAACLVSGPVLAQDVTRWRGAALGAEASIILSHPSAGAIIARAVAEIDRLEDVFSLYRSGSALSRLNASGRLGSPPFELLECLALSGRVHAATGGLFDPTVQPLWALYATQHAAGLAPDAAQIAEARRLTGWDRVSFDEGAVRLPAGGALTLNGVAQGFIADMVANLLREEGLTDILINTGELRALGGSPQGGAWPVRIPGAGKVDLIERALATSSPLGTCFDAAGRVGHILDPRTGLPAAATWRLASISAPRAALADALSTAACLMPDRETIAAATAQFSGARIEALV